MSMVHTFRPYLQSSTVEFVLSHLNLQIEKKLLLSGCRWPQQSRNGSPKLYQALLSTFLGIFGEYIAAVVDFIFSANGFLVSRLNPGRILPFAGPVRNTPSTL